MASHVDSFRPYLSGFTDPNGRFLPIDSSKIARTFYTSIMVGATFNLNSGITTSSEETSLTLRELATAYLAYLKKYRIKKPVTIKSEKAALYGKIGGTGSVIDELEHMGVICQANINQDKI